MGSEMCIRDSTSPPSSCDGCTRELDVQPISSDKYSGRCVTRVDRRFALSGELGGGGEACGGTVAIGEGAVIEVGCLFRMNRLFLTKTSTLGFDKVFPVWSDTSNCAIRIPQFGGWVLNGDVVSRLQVRERVGLLIIDSG